MFRHTTRIVAVLGLMAVCFTPPVSAAVDDGLLSARVGFLAARSALARGDEAGFQAQLKTLADYPLQRHLRFLRLQQRVKAGRASGDEIGAFVAEAPKHHLSKRLMNRWQRQLAQRGEWAAFMRARQLPAAAPLPCTTLEARHALGEVRDFSAAATGKLWVSDNAKVAPCARVFNALLAPKGAEPPIGLVWKRVYRLMAAGRLKQLEPLLKYLNRRDRGWVELWRDGHRNPLPALADERLREDSRLSRRVLMHVLRRHARKDLPDARQRWQQLRGQYSFSAADHDDIDRRLALTAAYNGAAQALDWLEALPARAHDKRTRAWRVRSALRRQDWPAALRGLDGLQAVEQADHEWRYWRARTLQALGQQGAARALYKVLAERTSYYGFLAADRLEQTYPIREETLELSDTLRGQLLLRDEIREAREYYRVGLILEARRVWNPAIRALDVPARLGAAVLAQEWGWHDRAVWTVAQTAHRNDYALRFPTPWDEQVRAASQAHSLEAAWIYGVMRRESAYMADVRSRAGAVGLMQLMPRTARFVGKKMGQSVRTAQLTDATLNIRLGSYYLNHVYQRFGHPALATAAYNAGPSRVKRWLPSEGSLAADIWVDTIPFTETRKYVRAVMAYTTVFQWRLSRQVTPLAERMPEIDG